MTIYITNIPSNKGNFGSGHNFWEIFTCYILSVLIPNVTPVYNNTWDKSQIVTFSMKKFNIKDIKNIKTITISKYHCYNSLNYTQFQELKNTILTNEKKYKNILVKLINVCSIHPDILCEWYNNKLIPKNIYEQKCKPMLEELYFSDNNSEELNIFSIHMRRGDLYNWTYNEGYDLEYYKNIINLLKDKLDIPIHIYTEKNCNTGTSKSQKTPYKRNFVDHDDIEIFRNMEGIVLKRGDLSDFSDHFNEMCRSKYLMLGISSMSLLAGFVSKGKIIVDERYKKSRPNLFRNIEIIPNFHVFKTIEEIGNFI